MKNSINIIGLLDSLKHEDIYEQLLNFITETTKQFEKVKNPNNKSFNKELKFHITSIKELGDYYYDNQKEIETKSNELFKEIKIWCVVNNIKFDF